MLVNAIFLYFSAQNSKINNISLKNIVSYSKR